MTAATKNNQEQESSSWGQVLDKIFDCASSSRPTLRFLNRQCSTGNEENAEVVQHNEKELIKRELIEGYQKDMSNGEKQENEIEKPKEFHFNKCFGEKNDSNIKYAAVYNYERFEKQKELAKRRYKSISFLDEQYNLTKQAITRRYRPQIKLNAVSSRNTTIADYFTEPFNDDLYKISNMSSHPIDVDKPKKYSPLINEIPSNPETFAFFK